jgi:hypothetical protein
MVPCFREIEGIPIRLGSQKFQLQRRGSVGAWHRGESGFLCQFVEQQPGKSVPSPAIYPMGLAASSFLAAPPQHPLSSTNICAKLPELPRLMNDVPSPGKRYNPSNRSGWLDEVWRASAPGSATTGKLALLPECKPKHG